jgi:hypothetical protein
MMMLCSALLCSALLVFRIISPNRSFDPPNVSISEFQVHYKLRLNSTLRCPFAVFSASFPRGPQMVDQRGWLDWVGGMDGLPH